MRSEALETRLMKRIDRKRGDVFMRADFKDLGGYDQVGRALRRLVSKGRLVKIGQGLYARALESPFDGTPSPVKGLRTLAAEALKRLGIESAPTRLEQEYNTGQTTQIPAGRTIGVTKRVRRKIGYNGIYVSFERDRPASR
ncbi:MAG: type IV toxin-antitoxin system AbiEi family antitoxin domain-containing protein [Deltaproteobacteria bacterium]|nr:type IV toxin-antitoxin system AbiEi family antitoxin domain-containing protein [Deltaproteobacteria bacterium]